jgi:hypothetical protein
MIKPPLQMVLVNGEYVSQGFAMPIMLHEFDESPEPANLEQLTRALSWPQYEFVTSPAKFPAMVAGYGAGKTEAAICRALLLKFKYPNLNVGYYLPTYSLIKDIVFPRVQEILLMFNIKHKLHETDKTLTVEGMKGTLICRTMDNPELIIGYEHAHAIVDELDTLKTDKAAVVWRKVVARNRQKLPDGLPNTIGVATTPEGYKFVYEKWKRTPLAGSQIIKASTYSNAKNLPSDYIETLRDNYPTAMLEAYLNGEFVNMTTGSVYADFDRHKNAAPLGEGIKPGETLHLGVDFNVGTMAAVVHILREGETIAVDEFMGLLDTPALIAAIKARYTGHRIMAYPDASGKSRKTVNASVSDIALLRQAGFMVLAKSTNPFVKDRVAAFNKLIHKDEKRMYKVNINNCPHLTEGLEKQAYNKNGEPDKTSGFDHVVDAAGYFVAYRFPILNSKARQTNVTGV